MFIRAGLTLERDTGTSQVHLLNLERSCLSFAAFHFMSLLANMLIRLIEESQFDFVLIPDFHTTMAFSTIIYTPASGPDFQPIWIGGCEPCEAFLTEWESQASSNPLDESRGLYLSNLCQPHTEAFKRSEVEFVTTQLLLHFIT